MKNTKAIVAALIAMLAALATGCGKQKIDVMESLDVKFNGVNGYGTAELEDAYGWESQAMEAAKIEIKDFYSLGEAFYLENAVAYEISPNENLSNGDEVIVKAVIDDEVADEYNIKFVADEKKFVVSGLKDVEVVDLFENIDVDFQGIAPVATATLLDGNTDRYIGVKRYTIDKTNNLNIGDIVTVKAEYDEDRMLDAGYIAENDTKEFIVPEIDRYAVSIDEISADAIQLLKKQTEDIIEADIANENKMNARVWSSDKLYTLDDKIFLGNYFLCAKNVEAAYRKNYCYFVYQLDMVGSEDFSCYYTVAYYDIIILEDGTCSYDFDKRVVPNPSVGIGWIRYPGYDSLDKLFNDCVTQNLVDYTYESTLN